MIYLLSAFLSMYTADAGMVKGYVNKKGRFTKPHVRINKVKIPKMRIRK